MRRAPDKVYNVEVIGFLVVGGGGGLSSPTPTILFRAFVFDKKKSGVGLFRGMITNGFLNLQLELRLKLGLMLRLTKNHLRSPNYYG